VSARSAELGVLGVCILIAVAAFWPRGGEPNAPTAPKREEPALSALPRGASLAVSLDFRRIRETELGSVLTEGGRVLPGVGSLSDVCGFDPTEQIREVALAQRDSDLGVVATGKFERARIVKCAAQVIARRGGEPTTSEIDSFATVRDRRGEGAEIAVRDGGPVLIGDGRTLREMIDTVEGKAESMLGDDAHATLRRAVGPGAAVATFVARPNWLARFLEPDEIERSALANVRAGAVRIEVAPDWVGTLLLACPDDRECEKLGNWAEQGVSDLRQVVRRELGDDPVQKSEVKREANAVRVRVTLDPHRTARVLTRLILDSPPEESVPAPQPSSP
jgi:hypothetical protein